MERQAEIILLRKLAIQHRALADYAEEENLSWKEAWDVTRRMQRKLAEGRELEGLYYQTIRQMRDLDLPSAEYIRAFREHADKFDAEADQLERKTT